MRDILYSYSLFLQNRDSKLSLEWKSESWTVFFNSFGNEAFETCDDHSGFWFSFRWPSQVSSFREQAVCDMLYSYVKWCIEMWHPSQSHTHTRAKESSVTWFIQMWLALFICDMIHLDVTCISISHTHTRERVICNMIHSDVTCILITHTHTRARVICDMIHSDVTCILITHTCTRARVKCDMIYSDVTCISNTHTRTREGEKQRERKRKSKKKWEGEAEGEGQG